jgi:methylated-DNA-[protein]-cysteine S-methyltransferase
MQFRLKRYLSPMGELTLITDPEGTLHALDFDGHEPRLRRLLRDHYGDCELQEGPAPKSLLHALDAYFAGDINALGSVPVATAGTAFQRSVWRELRKIPPGQTRSYGQIAAAIGCPGSSRAVGAASAANPVAIVVPCHRVIGADGTLTGFGGGLPRKRWLLDHERKYSRADLFSAAGAM